MIQRAPSRLRPCWILISGTRIRYDCCMYNTSLPGPMAAEPCLAARARQVHRVISRIYDRHLRDLHISIAQLDMLVTLLDAKAPVRPVDLAREMVMERSTVSRNLKRLQDLGLVELSPGATDREHHVSVTQRGRDVVFHAEEPWSQAQRLIKSLLGREAVRALELVSDQ